MKVLIVAHYYPPHVGGLEQVAKRQAGELAARGDEVTVVTCASGMRPGTVREEGVRVRRGFAFDFFDTRFGIPFPLPGPGLCMALFKEATRADLVHLHDVWYPTSWIAWLGARVAARPIVVTQHVALVEHPSALVMAAERLVYAVAGTLIWGSARAIVAYNAIVTDFLIKRGIPQEKLLVMFNGIDVERFHPATDEERREAREAFGLPSDRFLVLFVGRFVPKKGFDDLIGARSDDYDLVFAGSGQFPDDAKRAAGVHYCGSLAQEELAKLYRACDAFALPARGELFTLAMQEAMASGLPTITTDEPAYHDSALDANLVSLVKPDASELGKAIARIQKDEGGRLRMAEYSRAYALRYFDWRANVAPLLSLYGALVPEHALTVTTSWDDGHVLDVRLAALLKKHGVCGTFYVSPEDREFPAEDRLTDEGVAALAKDFEIGAHTMTHRHLTTLDAPAARDEMVRSKRYLENVIGKPVTSFCYPAGKFAPPHVAMARAAGFSVARTVARFKTRFDDPLAMPTTFHTYRHYSDVLSILRAVGPLRFWDCFWNWDALAIALFEQARKTGGVYHLWGHSWEIEKHGDWARLSRVLAHIGGRKDVRYATNGELV